jgi:hypothetical protein
MEPTITLVSLTSDNWPPGRGQPSMIGGVEYILIIVVVNPLYGLPYNKITMSKVMKTSNYS